MEDTLRAVEDPDGLKEITVLILVLMEDTLRGNYGIFDRLKKYP